MLSHLKETMRQCAKWKIFKHTVAVSVCRTHSRRQTGMTVVVKPRCSETLLITSRGGWVDGQLDYFAKNAARRGLENNLYCIRLCVGLSVALFVSLYTSGVLSASAAVWVVLSSSWGGEKKKYSRTGGDEKCLDYC